MTMFTITSDAFAHTAYIPRQYTCQGDDVNPPLSFRGVPAGTVSLALIMDDPDAPGGTWDHWTVWNIDPTQTEIAENSVPPGAIQGRNGRGRNAYGGPCPPSGTHRYFFRAYALAQSLSLAPGSSKKDLQEAMTGLVLAEAELIGLYRQTE